MSWRWDPSANEYLTRTSNVRILAPAERVVRPYDWQEDPDVGDNDTTLNPQGFTVKASERGSDWSAEYHLKRLRGELPEETLTPPDERDWAEEQDAREAMHPQAERDDWDSAHDAALDGEDPDWVAEEG